MPTYISTIGQDSHAFDMSFPEGEYLIRLAGVDILNKYPISANSDGDVVLHAITNAISGYTCVNVLGKIADDMCQVQGIKDSREYLKVALSYMPANSKITHLSISIECKYPKLSPHIDSMRSSIADILGIAPNSVGITATTGEGLTGMGRGEGIGVLCILSWEIG